ncbi:MAG: hypothetical protein LBQ58_06590 [Synergistaceae bacterium]|jgi:uroporphyrinogen-III decarboxylase|nr:hypothetical protein [Synergistaceae bacterium]
MTPNADALCVDRETGYFLELPSGFVTEAMALGAPAVLSESGIVLAEPLLVRPESLLEINDISLHPAVKEVLELIEKRSPGQEVMLNVQAPYSVLCTVTEQDTLHSWLVRYKSMVHEALCAITRGLAGYIREALQRGAHVVSIADPYACPEIIGASRHREFAAEYEYRLLRLLAGAPCGVVHLCPRCSLMLEKYGRIAARCENLGGKPYHEALLEAASEFAIVGHRCIHSQSAEKFYRLEIV